jgi:small subunit ribosomal protein S4
VKPGDVIELKDGSRSLSKLKGSLEANASRVIPKWLDFDKQKNVAKVIAEPAREDIDLPVEEHLIVELYSK